MLRLAEFFIGKYSTEVQPPAGPALSAALRAALQAYSWPGNIRELENVMKRFVILQDEPALLSDLRNPAPRQARRLRPSRQRRRCRFQFLPPSRLRRRLRLPPPRSNLPPRPRRPRRNRSPTRRGLPCFKPSGT